MKDHKFQAGDKLYRVFDGVLEVVTFVSKRAVPPLAWPGDSEDPVEHVLTCRKAGRGKFDCSMDMYERTELQAWERYEKECNQAEVQAAKALEEAQRDVSRIQVEWERAIEEIGRLKKKEARHGT